MSFETTGKLCTNYTNLPSACSRTGVLGKERKAMPMATLVSGEIQ